MDDLMVDIETFSLHPHNAVILSVAMIKFDPRGSELKLGNRCMWIPNIVDQLLIGRQVDTGTQKFWADPKLAEAAEHWRDHQPGCELPLLCVAMGSYLRTAKRIWANGILFDLSNIDGLYRQITGSGAPWHYQAPRDMRDRVYETPINPNRKFVAADHDPKAVAHHPMSDCISQCGRVWEHYYAS